jgi:Ala-tRNA(Pro) deacylase
MSTTVFERIEEWLLRENVPFAVEHHAPVYTSEQAAAVRGTSLASGAKALVVKAGNRFVMCVVPANRKLDNRKTRQSFRVNELRFATPEEVLELTGLHSGSIPPFGSLFKLPTYCDPTLAACRHINFNAGDHCISIQMAYADYANLEKPTPAQLI